MEREECRVIRVGVSKIFFAERAKLNRLLKQFSVRSGTELLEVWAQTAGQSNDFVNTFFVDQFGAHVHRIDLNGLIISRIITNVAHFKRHPVIPNFTAKVKFLRLERRKQA